jgi:succinyl-CoA synthetase beta subunit
MNIHEYQAKAILKAFGAPVSKGIVAFTAEEAEAAARELASPRCAVKAQIHAGGRGKGRFKEREAGDKGGVRLAKSPAEAREYAQAMLGHTLVTHQTGPDGKRVERVYVEAACDITRELYLSCVVDRGSGRLAFIASTEGGVNIEEVARQTPEKILTVTIDPATGVQPFHGRKIARGLGLSGELARECVRLVEILAHAFTAKDMSLLEINPLIVNAEGHLHCLDAKINFDDNALVRHKELVDLRDLSEEDPTEIEASRHDLSYVKLDGEIGCMVNGAGLAMATMDIIKLYGAEPANFLDVGGGATREKVTAAFKIILSDPNVKGVLVNIFGGIMRCDIIAEGIVAAAKEVKLSLPLVVRLEGTNVELGKKILSQSGLAVIPANDLGDAAEKIVKAVKAVRRA